MPHEVNAVLHYKPGTIKDEKFLPSTPEDFEKEPHNIPFNSSVQTAKNVGFTVKCEECHKSHLLHAKHKLIANEVKGAKYLK